MLDMYKVVNQGASGVLEKHYEAVVVTPSYIRWRPEYTGAVFACGLIIFVLIALMCLSNLRRATSQKNEHVKKRLNSALELERKVSALEKKRKDYHRDSRPMSRRPSNRRYSTEERSDDPSSDVTVFNRLYKNNNKPKTKKKSSMPSVIVERKKWSSSKSGSPADSAKVNKQLLLLSSIKRARQQTGQVMPGINLMSYNNAGTGYNTNPLKASSAPTVNKNKEEVGSPSNATYPESSNTHTSERLPLKTENYSRNAPQRH